MGSKKLQAWLPLIFSIVLVIGMFLGYQLKGTGGSSVFFKNDKKSSIQEVLDLINSKYVDDLAQDSFKNVVISDILSQLDPHSVYIPARELQSANDELKGNFQGIGIEFRMFNDTINVMNVIEGGPSSDAGIKAGDKIIKVNDTAILAGRKLDINDIRQYLRGPEGSMVKVTVLRGSQSKDFQVKRGIIKVPAVDVAYMIDDSTGFLRLNRFTETAYKDFMPKLEQLQQQGMKRLILDLRGNGGGVLSQAVEIADEFIDSNKLIVYTEGSKMSRADYRCKRDGLFEQGKLVVLVDETSASASEILSGALQDWDRAVIIGHRTFGKGLVQQQYTLSDGSAVRLTISRYYTPLGRNIQKPYNEGKEKYAGELMERYNSGEFLNGDTSKHIGPSFKTPAGHVVYGGGGITPDIFVPYDTTLRLAVIEKLYDKDIISRFIFDYYLRNEDFFKKFTSPEDMVKNYTPGEKEWSELTRYAQKDSINLSGIPPKTKQDLLSRIKALLARQIWRYPGYYKVINTTDPMIRRALESMNNGGAAK